LKERKDEEGKGKEPIWSIQERMGTNVEQSGKAGNKWMGTNLEHSGKNGKKFGTFRKGWEQVWNIQEGVGRNLEHSFRETRKELFGGQKCANMCVGGNQPSVAFLLINSESRNASCK
jgi:hypothetical protein